MCGIVGAVAQRNVTPILIEGLKRLEYRGYDSAGVAVIADGRLQLARAVGKVAELEALLAAAPPFRVPMVGVFPAEVGQLRNGSHAREFWHR